MTIYDILERVVHKTFSDEYERASALDVVEELRAVNAFGTSAARARAGDHEHVPAEAIRPPRCGICGERL